ncbi:MAG: hypothetical protein F6K00_33745 [Leptolyngbya sp. SIOISBB]|nr:hypothetical protein [Leptolyngbya sp. SIOISBB]
MNGSDRQVPGRNTSKRELSLPEDSLIHAIGDVGQTVDRLQISVERQIRELTEYVNQCERNHQEDMGHWRTVTEELAQLLHIKTQATQEVSNSYMRLAEHLAKFNNYLLMSESTLSKVEQPLLSLSKALPSLSDASVLEPSGMSSLQMQEVLQAIAEVQTAIQQMQEGMKQTLRQIHQGGIAFSQPKKETSIWTDLANWKAGMFWFGMGSLFVAGMMFVVFRGSGFQQAMRAMQLQGGMVDARLERIEIWLGIEGVDDETPEFEDQPMPEE